MLYSGFAKCGACLSLGGSRLAKIEGAFGLEATEELLEGKNCKFY